MSKEADVCLVLEGTYPYVAGGVSSWVHDLIEAQEHLTFHIVALMPPNMPLQKKYKLPRNVIEVSNIFLQSLPSGSFPERRSAELFSQLREPLLRIQDGGHLQDVDEVRKLLEPLREVVGKDLLLNSRSAWELMGNMYDATMQDSSLLDYFWSWRALFGGFYSVMLAEVPKAKLYHCLCTGYAGLYATRAKLETNRPAIITEHGIYTNERRIEIALAEWLMGDEDNDYSIDLSKRDIRDFWIDTFASYSRACYESMDAIITLYSGNQRAQLADGAPLQKLRIIPNGVDCNRFAQIKSDRSGSPTIALIGRVVPIKDVKTFIRACSIIRDAIPDVEILIMGPTDEDEEYFRECQKMVEYMGMVDAVNFTGRVQIDKYLQRIDVIVLTSISEAQPLVILEAGAAGIPCVATDVGACSEMILGHPSEKPRLGAGGAITPLANPTAIASEVVRLLGDSQHYESCRNTMRERVWTYYNKSDMQQTYKALYQGYIGK
jgi:glycosyltransferase involved in cell wall biosynthesis